MVLKAAHTGGKVFGKTIYVLYNNKVYLGSCLRHRLHIGDNVKVTAVTKLGHVRGLVRIRGGIEYLDVAEIYSRPEFNYPLLDKNIYLSKNTASTVAKIIKRENW